MTEPDSREQQSSSRVSGFASQYVTPPEKKVSSASVAKHATNPALVTLVVVGSVLTIGGSLMAQNAASSAKKAADVEGFTRAISADSGIYMGNPFDVQPDYTTAIIWGVVAGLGALMLVAALVVAAVRQRGRTLKDQPSRLPEDD